MMKKTEVVVIGGGPGGYVAAIRLGQLGKKVCLIEKENVGGVCLNWGCIPSKALIGVGKLYEEMQQAHEVGLNVGTVTVDLNKTQAWKNSVVKKLTSGVASLAKNVGVEIIKAKASFTSPNELKLESAEGTSALTFEQAIIAAGSSPIEIPGFALDGKAVVDSRDALDWTKVPKRMLVIGGGVIGLEMGMLYQKFGSHISVVEMTDQLLPGTDKEIAKEIAKVCNKKNMDIHLSSKALGYEQTKDGLQVSIEKDGKTEKVACDIILLAVGRKPDGSSLNLDAAGVTFDRKIPVNEKLQTNVPHIYAIGDIAGPPLLAHKASKEGVVAAEVIAGKNVVYDVRAMPGAIFTDPEVASVGMTEEEAKEKGIDYFTGKFPMIASGRALASRHTDGFVKVIAENGSEKLLGVHMIGAHVSELIGEGTLAIEMGAVIEDIALTVHPHPTLSECLMEAAENALGHAIHTVNKKTNRKAS
ncbi:MAG TPA: dihydrolipoyl dehydrogenase [Oligoflexia bacterium]|nr:dihydrolipoyl dehydrogenase [Oligoflexia bacterium]